MNVSVAVLGATGLVGQKAIALLAQHHRFRVKELVASEQRIGEEFASICNWREPLNMPQDTASIKLCSINHIQSDFIVSCLPATVAITAEVELAQKGKIVFSNASSFRMQENVPLLIPEINLDHLSLLTKQRTNGKIITNPNCAAAGVAMALAPLRSLGIIEHVSVVTLQSISGAGYPGIASLDILGNTIPHIADEADKITEETKKILGTPEHNADFTIATNVHRVPVLYGHTATLHIKFQHKPDLSTVKNAYENWNTKYKNIFVIHTEDGRPQPNKDLTHNDMRVHIGHLQITDNPNIIGLVCLTHNLVRGAAGAAIANMESYLDFIGI